MNPRTFLFLLGFASLAAGPRVHPQSAVRLKIAVVVSDSGTGGIFQSAFSGAFRRLGDIDVVLPAEDPDYVLEGVVLCNESCPETSTYSISIRLYEPLSRAGVWALAQTSVVGSTLEGKAVVDTIADRLWPFLAGYQKTHQTWTARWGRSRYEAATLELVREIDTRCLDRIRAMKRLVRNSSPSTVQGYKQLLTTRQWLC